MHIGLFTIASNPFGTPEYLRTFGELADARGFHSVWVAEHVVLFDQYASQYPYSADGKIPAGGETGPLEPFNTLAFLAAVTSRVRLGTGICLVPQRNPVYTAKDVASVDWLSNGRCDFGVGVGWLKEEFDALGVSFDQRGARCRAYLEVMRRLWCDPISEYDGKFYHLPACRQYPKPVQQPHPPIHFGGESDAALRRVVDLGQGWYPFNLGPDDLKARTKDLTDLLARRNRKRTDIQISTCPYMQAADLDAVRRYRDAGADQVILMAFAATVDSLREKIDDLAETILEPMKRGA